MRKTDCNYKRILIVEENSDLFEFLEEEIRETGLKYRFDKADTFPQAINLMFSGVYDLVILEFPGIRGPYLLNLAFLKEIPVVLVTSFHLYSIEASHLFEKGIKGLLPREKIGEIVPILENLFSNNRNGDPRE
jgi:DNA-binding response OmpR family regulator